MDEREAAEMAERLRKSEFTLEDFRTQLKAMRKMGPLQQIVGMLPGHGRHEGRGGHRLRTRSAWDGPRPSSTP